jgi:hypothetical protein
MSGFDEEAEARRLAAKWRVDETSRKSPLDGLNEEQRLQAELLLGREGVKHVERASGRGGASTWPRSASPTNGIG